MSFHVIYPVDMAVRVWIKGPVSCRRAWRKAGSATADVSDVVDNWLALTYDYKVYMER